MVSINDEDTDNTDITGEPEKLTVLQEIWGEKNNYDNLSIAKAEFSRLVHPKLREHKELLERSCGNNPALIYILYESACRRDEIEYLKHKLYSEKEKLMHKIKKALGIPGEDEIRKIIQEEVGDLLDDLR